MEPDRDELRHQQGPRPPRWIGALIFGFAAALGLIAAIVTSIVKG